MGLVPSFATWGIAAAVLMVVLRLVQGFCLGGELPGALTTVVETRAAGAVRLQRGVLVRHARGRGGEGVSLALRTWLPAELGGERRLALAFVLGGWRLVSFAAPLARGRRSSRD
jgi:hypothetical protein